LKEVRLTLRILEAPFRDVNLPGRKGRLPTRYLRGFSVPLFSVLFIVKTFVKAGH